MEIAKSIDGIDTSVRIRIADHEWIPVLPKNPDLLVFGNGGPFADYGPNTKFYLEKCNQNCASVDQCKKICLDVANTDTTRTNAYLQNFASIFGVTQNKKTALLIRTRKKAQKEKPESESDSESESESAESETDLESEVADEEDDDEDEELILDDIESVNEESEESDSD
jgi:hypothetical protein